MSRKYIKSEFIQRADAAQTVTTNPAADEVVGTYTAADEGIVLAIEIGWTATVIGVFKVIHNRGAVATVMDWAIIGGVAEGNNVRLVPEGRIGFISGDTIEVASAILATGTSVVAFVTAAA